MMMGGEKFFSEYADLLPYSVMEIAVDGFVRFANEEAFRTFGYTRDDLEQGIKALDLFSPADRSRIRRRIGKILKGQRVCRMGVVALRKDGSEFPVSIHGAPIVRDSLVSGWLLSTTVDITPCKQVKDAPDAFHEATERFRVLIEHSIDGIIVLNKDGVISYASPSTERMSGYAPEEVIGKSPIDFLHPADMLELRQAMTDLIRNKESIIRIAVRFRHKDGSWRWIEGTGRNLLDNPYVSGIVANFHDVTLRKQVEQELRLYYDRLDELVAERTIELQKANEDLRKQIKRRRRAERELKQKEAYFRLLLENSSDMTVVLNRDAIIEYASPSLERIGGYEVKDLLGKYAFDFVHPDDREKAETLFSEGIRTPGYTTTIEIRLPRKDGTWRYVELIGKNLLEEPTVKGVVLNFHDIEERKVAELALRASEERFRALIENAAEGISIIAPAGCIMYTGPSNMRILGRRDPGKTMLDYVHPDDQQIVAEDFRQLLMEPGAIITKTYRVQHGDGNWHVCEVVAQNLIENPSIRGIVANFRDVTERQRAEEALKESETKFNQTFLLNPHVVSITSLKTGRLVDVNDAFAQLIGKTREELIGQLAVEVFPLKNPEVEHDIRRGLLRDGEVRNLEVVSSTESGEEIIGLYSAAIIRINGEPHVLAVINDVTDLKAAERALKESEEKFRTIFETVTEEIIFVDESGTILDVNDKVKDIWGYSPEEIIGRKFYEFEFALPESLDHLVRVFGQAFGRDETNTIELGIKGRRKDGTTLFAELSGKTMQIQGRKAAVVIVRDITERKLAEEALQASEERFRTMIEDSHDAIVLTDAEGIVQYASPSLERIMDYPLDDLLGTSMMQYIHPDDHTVVRDVMNRILGERGAAQSLLVRLRRNDGSWFWVDGVAKNLLHDPRVCALVATFRDVTDRVAAEEVLREAEEKWRALADNSPAHILSVGPDGTILFINRPLPGYQLEQVIGSCCYDYVPRKTKRVVKKIIDEAFRTGRWQRTEAVILLPDGSKPWYEITAVPIMRNQKVTEVIYLANDITERKRNQEQLQQYARELEEAHSELSEYAQVVVHDIGTPLRAIRYHTRILRNLPGVVATVENEQRACLDTIDDAVSECEELARNLSGLAQLGRSELRIEPVDMDVLLRKTIASACTSREVQVSMGENWPTIKSDPVLLGHIFRNLVDNAIKFNDAPDKRIEFGWKPIGKGMYEFSITDNGIGIDPRHHEEIFQVFRRLHHQDDYKGIGIGLAIVKKATSMLGGTVRVESVPGRGSTFTVTIPRYQRKRR